jgi:hypothetical protein
MINHTLAIDVVQCVLILALGGFVLRLRGRCSTLEQQQQQLQDQLEKHRRDQYGLCSAAVQVDKRLMEQEKRLKDIMEKIQSVAIQESAATPYYTAIDRIRKGAGPEQLVAEYGMALSEAKLLHNLYGQQTGAGDSQEGIRVSHETHEARSGLHG